MKEIPVWLVGSDRSVINKLLADGFIYYGCPHVPENMFSPENIGDWTISPGCQEPTIEVCHRYGALFLKEYRADYSDLNDSEYERIKALISKSIETNNGN